jgi:hypothetical protein
MFGFFQPPKDRVEFFEKHSNLDEKNYWDPANNFDKSKINKDCAKLRARYEFLKNNPGVLKKNLILTIFFSIIFSVFLGFIGWFSKEFFFLYVALFVLFFIPLIISLDDRKISIDLIKLKLADDHGWAYDPRKSSSRWKILSRSFPEIFNKGNQSQNVEDQFWGEFNYKNKKHLFHSGLFHYTVRHGKNSTSYSTNYYVLKLNQKLKSRFHLYSGSFIFGKKLKTESIEFNKSFKCSYKGKRGEHEINIMGVLSPVVQQKILDLKNEKKSLEILFVDDCILFLFRGVLLKKLKTNFYKSIEINKEDYHALDKDLKTVLDLGTDIAYYLD